MAGASITARLPRVLVVGPGRNQVGGISTFIDSLLSSDQLKQKYELIHLDTSRAPGDVGLAGRFSLLNLGYFFRQVGELMAVAIRCKPQILHLPVTSYLSFWKISVFMLLGQALGIKVVMHLHGGRFEEYYDHNSLLLRALIRRIFSRADIVVVLSERWKRFLLTQVRPDLRIEIVPNAVDTMFAQSVSEDLNDAERDPNAVLFVGSLGRGKGVFDILKAVPRVRAEKPEARFLFAGNEETQGARAQIDRACSDAGLGNAVHFLGRVTGPAKLELFKRAAVFILPSYAEGFPYALLEAMAAGLPVITTPVGTIPEVVEDGRHGFLIEPGDWEELARRIIQLLDDSELKRRMSRENVERVRSRYMPEVAITRLDAIYARLIVGEKKELDAERRRQHGNVL